MPLACQQRNTLWVTLRVSCDVMYQDIYIRRYRLASTLLVLQAVTPRNHSSVHGHQL